MAQGAYEVPGFKFGPFAANGDLSADQFHFVNLNGSGTLDLAGDGGRAIAVLQNKPKSGDVCELTFDGISKVVAGAAITVGDDISSDSTGRAQTSDSGDIVLGVAFATAAGAGVLIPVALFPRIAKTP